VHCTGISNQTDTSGEMTKSVILDAKKNTVSTTINEKERTLTEDNHSCGF